MCLAGNGSCASSRRVQISASGAPAALASTSRVRESTTKASRAGAPRSPFQSPRNSTRSQANATFMDFGADPGGAGRQDAHQHFLRRSRSRPDQFLGARRAVLEAQQLAIDIDAELQQRGIHALRREAQLELGHRCARRGRTGRRSPPPARRHPACPHRRVRCAPSTAGPRCRRVRSAGCAGTRRTGRRVRTGARNRTAPCRATRRRRRGSARASTRCRSARARPARRRNSAWRRRASESRSRGRCRPCAARPARGPPRRARSRRARHWRQSPRLAVARA